jgi:hypothetical protein
MDRRLGGQQSLSGSYGDKRNLFPFPGIEDRFLGCPVCMLNEVVGIIMIIKRIIIPPT